LDMKALLHVMGPPQLVDSMNSTHNKLLHQPALGPTSQGASPRKLQASSSYQQLPSASSKRVRFELHRHSSEPILPPSSTGVGKDGHATHREVGHLGPQIPSKEQLCIHSVLRPGEQQTLQPVGLLEHNPQTGLNTGPEISLRQLVDLPATSRHSSSVLPKLHVAASSVKHQNAPRAGSRKSSHQGGNLVGTGTLLRLPTVLKDSKLTTPKVPDTEGFMGFFSKQAIDAAEASLACQGSDDSGMLDTNISMVNRRDIYIHHLEYRDAGSILPALRRLRQIQ